MKDLKQLLMKKKYEEMKEDIRMMKSIDELTRQKK